MKADLVAVLLFLAVCSSPAQIPYTEQQVVAYAKSIDVNTLDPSLPSERLEDWLQSGPPHAHILMWIVQDTCQLKPDTGEDYPLCAEVRVSRNGEAGIILIQVGTLQKGIVGSPRLYGAGVEEIKEPLVRTGGAEHLSELPAILDQPPIVPNVRKLYEEIVTHQPIGIPDGAVKAAIWPLLSKRLTEQLETAHACQNDYMSQHPTADQDAKPSWLKSGLFSGDGKKALPTDFLPFNKEKLNDGSFLVHVQLGQGSLVLCGSHFWRVAARVIAEDGRFVVDDIRVFDCFSTNGPSRLLSDSFAGCNGPHWIGYGKPD